MSTPRSAASELSDLDAATFADEVARSLTQTPRQLSSRYLYDRLGSALFEAICRLPWYRITEVEQRLLRAHAATILERMQPLSTVVELGPGSGEKLVTLLAPDPGRTVTVQLVDVSADALAAASRTLGGASIGPIIARQATYDAGLSAIAREAWSRGRALVVFLGSNIGNFDTAGARALLTSVRRAVRVGDALLLGVDLVKPERELLLAYDDPLGVTAAFNRNLLVRINRELGGDFDVERFAHRALWNADAGRMEMHLVSLVRQRVRVRASGLDITFDAGETIWTESSYKYRVDQLAPLLAGNGFSVDRQWTDEGFALTLAEATS
jgi:dimethylhistidine N-methyltransferase